MKNGFKQTEEHRAGRHSHHQVGVFSGQPIGDFTYPEGDPRNADGLTPLERFMAFLAQSDVDAIEISSWNLDLRRAYTNEEAVYYARELHAMASRHNLEIPSLAAHLQGQCLGDRATVKTIQFQGGEVVAAYQQWLNEGNIPPEDNPFFVPEHVAELSRKVAVMDLMAVGRLAAMLSVLQKRDVVVSGFVGSAGAWDEIFPFPPIPTQCGSSGADKQGKVFHIGNRAEYALGVIIRRFSPVWDFYKSIEVKFALESHPSEIAAGDITSTKRFLDATDAAGYNGTVGLNLDVSHIVWQDVDPIDYIVTFIEYIFSVHHKGVQVRKDRRSKSGVLGGWAPFGTFTRFWDFVFASSDRDSTQPEDILIVLNENGYSGAITIEAEDNGFDLRAAIPVAVRKLREIDLTPSGGAFDAAFAAK